MPAVGRKENETYVNSWKMEPLALAVLAALTPTDIEVKFFDDRLESIPYDEPTDLVAINAETYTAKRAYQISSQFRKRKVPVILGGYHPTLMPEEAGEYADSVVVGEAEKLWPKLIDDVKKNRLQKIYRSVQRPLLNDIKPRRDIFEGKKYLPLALVESARGCRFSCNFCSISSFFNQTYNPRPVSEVVTEIGCLGRKSIFLVDDNIIADPQRTKELFRALIPLKINWISQGTINIANDNEMLELMKKSGCLGLLIGFESLNKNNLTQMGKSWNTQNSNYEDVLKKISDYGIAVYATFIFGYDNDDEDSFKRTLEFALEQKFFLAAFNHLVPFPGTPLYDELKKQGRLLYEKWWLDEKYRFGDVAFKPKHMSAQQLSQACFEARQKFYQFNAILKRGIDFKNNCKNLKMFVNFYLYNIFSQKEVRKRQGLPLGEGLDSGRKK